MKMETKKKIQESDHKIRHQNFEDIDKLIAFVEAENVRIISIMRELDDFVLIYGIRRHKWNPYNIS